MPELPEVETTRRGIEPHVIHRPIAEIIVRESRLRHPVSTDLATLTGDQVLRVKRRGKYLILLLQGGGHLLIHLGMSGSLRLSHPSEELRKHDHVIFAFKEGDQLRYHDPRRFGLVLLGHDSDPLAHPLLAHLGPEPLTDDFCAEYLHAFLRKRKAAIKLTIMDAKCVVGVGNIYASEALFRAGIRPATPAGKISSSRLTKLVVAIKEVLGESIEQGGTTLRDFLHSDGQPGYFKQRLFVYDRASHPCRTCATPIRHQVMGQRSTYWCPQCQS